MSENKLSCGVVIEFDFTAIDGANILFNVAKERLAAEGVDLTLKLEALHLVGGNYQGGLTELFSKLEKEADCSQIARDINEAFNAEVTKRLSGAVTPGIKEFINKVIAKDVKVILATRGDVEALASALEGFDSEKVVPYAEKSMTYGNGKWDVWRRALNANALADILTVGITGSGNGVKAVLVAGMPAIAVVNDHVSYQDFGGADCVVDSINGDLADEVLRILRLA
jgi:beta-phosphoglucomutase-like phosphatase (HAD superfamily)